MTAALAACGVAVWAVAANPASSAPAVPAAVQATAPATAKVPEPQSEPRWPAAGAPLMALPLEVPRGFGRKRVYLDAGHGARDNLGVQSVTCEQEMDFTLRTAEDLAQRL